MLKKKKNIKKAQSKATVDKLIRIASEEFSRHGYAGASTERIVKTAGLTRGALYHHFKGKPGLFYAVFCNAQKEIGRRIEKKALAAPDLWGQLVKGCHGFLEACSDPELQRIVVIDGPSVLKWENMRKLDTTLKGSGFSQLKACLSSLLDQKIIKPLPVDALAHLLNGAMDEAAVWIAQANHPESALQNAKSVLDELLMGLKLD